MERDPITGHYGWTIPDEFKRPPRRPRPDEDKGGMGSGIAAAVAVLAAVGIFNHLFAHGSSNNPKPTVVEANYPAALPPQVKAHETNAAQVNNYIYKGNSSKGNYLMSYSASGTVLNSNFTLSAGHLMLGNNGKPRAGKDRCEVVTQSVYNPNRQANFNFNVGYYSASFRDADNTKLPDISVLANPPGSLDSVSPLDIAKKEPKIGQTLYFLNEQPISQKQDRSPELAESGPRLAKDASPAIYAGTDIGTYSNGDIVVMTGLKSYGEVRQANSVKGASGGEVLNQFGQLVGITVAATDSSVNNSTLESNYNFNLQGGNPSYQLGVSLVQPVTEAEAYNLADQVGTDKLCQ